MEHKIVNIPYAKLRKFEVRKVARETIRIVEKHDPELLLIDTMYEMLLADKPLIDALGVPYKGHPASKKLEQQRKLLNLSINTIKFELKKIVVRDDTGYDETVLLLKNELGRFIEDLHKSDSEALMLEKLDLFIVEIDNNEPLAVAMESKGFITLLVDLKLRLTDVLSLLNVRLTDISNRPKMKTTVLRKKVVKGVTNMFNEIYLAQFKNSALDYSSLFNELNEMLKGVDRLVNIRLANNERKAAERKAAKEAEENGASTTEATSSEGEIAVAGSDNGYHPSQVYVASIKKMDSPLGETSSIAPSNGSLESEEQKKAVVSSWGTTQQPSNSDKA